MLDIDLFQVSQSVKHSFVPKIDSVSMWITDAFMLSPIIWNCKMLEIYQISEAIRHHTFYLVLKKEYSDDLSLSVTSDPVPVILTRVTFQPVFFNPPPISLSSIVKINKRLSLTWACVCCAPVHIACWPFMIVCVHQLIWGVSYIVWSLIWIWEFHQRVIWIVKSDGDRLEWVPFLI